MTELKDITSQIKGLVNDAGGSFLDLAQALRRLQELSADLKKVHGMPDDPFLDLVKKLKVGRRRAYYLVSIDREFGGGKVPVRRLRKIGWTKLMVLVQHVTPDNRNDLLDLAEENTVEELRAILANGEPRNNHVVLRFTDKQIGIFEGALLTSGAYLTEAGYVANREAAILRIIRLYNKALTEGLFL